MRSVKIFNCEKYQINEAGEIFSHQGWAWKKLKLVINRFGYLTVSLSLSKRKPKTYTVHRLVALHFIENENKHPVINHKDGDKQNNHVSNLEWTTPEMNMRHAYSMGLKVPNDQKGEKNPGARLSVDEVMEIKLLRSQGYKLADIAAKYGITDSHVCNLFAQRAWKHI